MKRIVCLALVIAFMLALSGMAESLNITKDKVNLALPKTDKLITEMPLDSLSDTGDIVTVEGSSVTVDTGDITFHINLPQGIDCFTQDYWASLLTYARYGASRELADNLAEGGIHLLLVDPMSMDEVTIKDCGSDPMTEEIGNITALPEKYIDTVGLVIAEINGATYTGQYKTDSNLWLKLNDDYMITVVNGRYIIAVHDSYEMTEDQIAMLHEIVDVLSVA